MDWTQVTPNEAGDWINQRNAAFASYPPIGDKDSAGAIFRTYSGGLKTNRDAWVYNSSRAAVERTARATVDFYNSEVDRYIESLAQTRGTVNVDDFINTDYTRISWNRADKNNIARGTNAPRYQYDEDAVRLGDLPPVQQAACLLRSAAERHDLSASERLPAPEDRTLDLSLSHRAPGPISRTSQWTLCPTSAISPTQRSSSRAIHLARLIRTRSLRRVALDRIDNISDRAHADYQRAYGPEVTKDDIFYSSTACCTRRNTGSSSARTSRRCCREFRRSRTPRTSGPSLRPAASWPRSTSVMRVWSRTS